MRESVEIVRQFLEQIELPVLSRHASREPDAAAADRAAFQLKRFSYASMTYVRDLLQALSALESTTNRAGVDLVVRSLYEWTMQASYVVERATPLMSAANYSGVDELLDPIFGGNSWIKKHGGTYAPPPINGLEKMIPNAVRLKHYAKAYKEFLIRSLGEENVDDDYGYLSELAHPNSFCLIGFTVETPTTVQFVRPTGSRVDRGLVVATLLTWCLCLIEILQLTDEKAAKSEFVRVLSELARHAGESKD